MLLMSLIIFLAPPAIADDTKKEEPRVVYKAKTEIDFESVEIAGELVLKQLKSYSIINNTCAQRGIKRHQ